MIDAFNETLKHALDLCDKRERDAAKPKSQGAIIKHIAKKTGAYDEEEQRFLADPYVDGMNSFRAGTPLDESKRRGVPKFKNDERIMLQRKGWADACKREGT